MRDTPRQLPVHMPRLEESFTPRFPHRGTDANNWNCGFPSSHMALNCDVLGYLFHEFPTSFLAEIPFRIYGFPSVVLETPWFHLGQPEKPALPESSRQMEASLRSREGARVTGTAKSGLNVILHCESRRIDDAMMSSSAGEIRAFGPQGASHDVLFLRSDRTGKLTLLDKISQSTFAASTSKRPTDARFAHRAAIAYAKA